MNIAFSALVIVIVVLLGIVFRYWYRKGSWESPVIFASLAEEIAYSLFFVIALHAAAIGLVRFFGEACRQRTATRQHGRTPTERIDDQIDT